MDFIVDLSVENELMKGPLVGLNQLSYNLNALKKGNIASIAGGLVLTLSLIGQHTLCFFVTRSSKFQENIEESVSWSVVNFLQ